MSFAGLRALQAIGYVFFTTGSTAQVSDVMPSERRAGALALFGIAANAAMALTSAAVGAALPVLTRKEAFWVAGGPAALSGGVVVVLARAPREAGRGTPVGLALVRLVTPLRVAALAAGLFGAGFGAFLQFLPLLAERLGLGTAGLAYTTHGAVIVVTRLVVRRSLDEGKRTRDVFAGFLALALGLGGFAVSHSHGLMLLAATRLAVGSGILHPALTAAHLEHVPVVERGRAVASFYLGFDLGIGLGAWPLSPAIHRFGLTRLYRSAAAAAAMGMALGRWVASDRSDLVGTAMTE